MNTQPVKVILTDIEGTTSSISFVADELFPYFREHIRELLEWKHLPAVQEAFAETVRLAQEQDGESISDDEQILTKLHQWSVEDRKITPLKTLQGVLWDTGYRNGSLKGHVYSEVPGRLKAWKEQGLQLAVFSSGSVPAQKLIFGFSVAGDLTPYFSAYFDTKTGGKREAATYAKIADSMQVAPNEILFLSDIKEELEAAKESGLQTIQLLREDKQAEWPFTAVDFEHINPNA
ncbi:MAG: acireductone synthase [Fluviicola sp.]|jgi:enolase-phosphatase E1